MGGLVEARPLAELVGDDREHSPGTLVAMCIVKLLEVDKCAHRALS